MNTIYNNHINTITNIIDFLEKYKITLESNKNSVMNNSKICAMFLLDNKLEELKDDALYILNDSSVFEPKIKQELDEYNESIDNMKSIMPFITYLMVLKSSISYQENP